ncbi:MAG: DUF5752 family protein [Candidatus Woesearchaeota archaeon]
MSSLRQHEESWLLRQVPDDQALWLCNNATVQSMIELAETLECLDDATFRYHVQRSQNDFAQWIRHTVGDRDLAREISRVKTKETLARKIDKRLRALRRGAV